jgi:hypothetical protein
MPSFLAKPRTILRIGHFFKKKTEKSLIIQDRVLMAGPISWE